MTWLLQPASAATAHAKMTDQARRTGITDLGRN
jgi:hypothetical protein